MHAGVRDRAHGRAQGRRARRHTVPARARAGHERAPGYTAPARGRARARAPPLVGERGHGRPARGRARARAPPLVGERGHGRARSCARKHAGAPARRESRAEWEQRKANGPVHTGRPAPGSFDEKFVRFTNVFSWRSRSSSVDSKSCRGEHAGCTQRCRSAWDQLLVRARSWHRGTASHRRRRGTTRTTARMPTRGTIPGGHARLDEAVLGGHGQFRRGRRPSRPHGRARSREGTGCTSTRPRRA